MLFFLPPLSIPHLCQLAITFFHKKGFLNSCGVKTLDCNISKPQREREPIPIFHSFCPPPAQVQCKQWSVTCRNEPPQQYMYAANSFSAWESI